VVSAILEWKFADSFPVLGWATSAHGETIALVMFIILAIYLYLDSRNVKKED